MGRDSCNFEAISGRLTSCWGSIGFTYTVPHTSWHSRGLSSGDLLVSLLVWFCCLVASGGCQFSCFLLLYQMMDSISLIPHMFKAEAPGPFGGGTPRLIDLIHFSHGIPVILKVGNQLSFFYRPFGLHMVVPLFTCKRSKWIHWVSQQETKGCWAALMREGTALTRQRGTTLAHKTCGCSPAPWDAGLMGSPKPT